MLLGRSKECEVIDRVLHAARSGRGGTILVHGEPGIGKSALLDYAAGAATGFQVLRAVGSEAEVDLAFAALQQLCAPCLASLERLPAPQRDALRVALGHTTGPAPDRLLIGLALLSLLSQLSSEHPVLCIADDAQWFDRESGQAFAFAARRLHSE